MSVENLKKYGKLCSENEEIRKKAKEIGIKDMDGHIAHAKSLGLEISKKDFETLAKETGLDGKDELNEEDLKKVAGGFATTTVAMLGLLVAGSLGLAAAANKPRW
jgi:predicted ribosomally synthesized peptide with nif11-like leader